ncbi:hypothetical protein AG1IA_04258 [Rhizoctonia solani AG-1 IA]|uniref:Uncharacterized protein n=1 Tax=Thanatephorus cucumeris (strain AG1-IA) TaxID=983506 RepID=L8WUN8_THACA|nr:hypothetical protein AG1IA_04258 [Rhizoctonia solani AG-1 IA]
MSHWTMISKNTQNISLSFARFQVARIKLTGVGGVEVVYPCQSSSGNRPTNVRAYRRHMKVVAPDSGITEHMVSRRDATSDSVAMGM